MKPPFLAPVALCSALLAASSLAAPAADPLPVATRKVFEQNKDSVVWISAVAKMSFDTSGSKAPMNIPEEERKFETVGTIIDSSGLVVAALSGIDPTRVLSGRELNTPAGVRVESPAQLKRRKSSCPTARRCPPTW